MMTVDLQESKMSIRLLEKTFQIKCPPEQIESLRGAADFLDQEMRKMREAGVVGLDRIAIITALNLAHELNASNAKNKLISSDFVEKIRALDERISETLAQTKQLEVPLEISLEE
jgi:cell division protein ZapA